LPLPVVQGCAVEEVIAVIIKSGGPENNGTQAEAVKWHDDKVRSMLSMLANHGLVQHSPDHLVNMMLNSLLVKQS
jgi:Mn-dependent DtxR family transcriptional regulator